MSQRTQGDNGTSPGQRATKRVKKEAAGLRDDNNDETQDTKSLRSPKSLTTSTAGENTPTDSSIDLVRPSLLEPETRSRLRAAYEAADPFPHCVLEDFMDERFMKSLREELLQLAATYKETDLFKVYQTPDFANIDLNPEAAAKLPSLRRLRNTLYSESFREFMADLTGSGPLSGKTDMAGNVYRQGCHLLTHDDVIGTRRVSYIVYLSDDGWTKEDGGCLELYPPSSSGRNEKSTRKAGVGQENDGEGGDENASAQQSSRGDGEDGGLMRPALPAASPTAVLPPVFNSLGIFTVRPGVSFHSVQEVFSPNKQRLSIQGWFHADVEPEGKEFASLQQVKLLAAGVRGNFTAIPQPLASASGKPIDSHAETEVIRGRLRVLREARVNPLYLQPSVLAQVQAHFQSEGTVQLPMFLAPDYATGIVDCVKSADAADNLGGGRRPGSYDAGIGGEWVVKGPPHMQRFLELCDKGAPQSPSGAGLSHTVCGEAKGHAAAEKLGNAMGLVRDDLFATEAFAWLVSQVTGLPLKDVRVVARRFRPGLDYTVATTPEDVPVIDASLAFVDDTVVDAEAAWESGECGGFECHIKAEAEDNPEVVAVYDDTSGDDDGDGGVMNINASSNSLNLVLRNPDTMSFVKYVAAVAPSSRVDVTASFTVDAIVEDDK